MICKQRLPFLGQRLIYLLIFGCAGSSLLHRLFSSCGKQGPLSSCDAWTSHCGDFCCDSGAVEYRLNGCDAWAQLHHGMWGLPGPGTESASPALAGGFFTTKSSGKPQRHFSLQLSVSILFLKFYIQAVLYFKKSHIFKNFFSKLVISNEFDNSYYLT